MLQPVLRRGIAAPSPLQRLVDTTIALGVLTFMLCTLATGAFGKSGDRPLDALGVVLAIVVSLPLAGRRVMPIPVLAVVTAATASLYSLGFDIGPPVGLIVALYSVAERRDERRPWANAAALGLGLVALIAFHTARNGIGIELAGVTVLWAAAWFAGDRARLRREQMAELEGRARRAELDAERERRLAIAEERTRIARELHDSAGHAVNVILVQAGAARLLHERDPSRSRAALATIETVARETISEIDRLVHVLREDDDTAESGDVARPAGLDALETLAERHRAGGLDLRVGVRGESRPLAARVDRAAYRILQEAMTNAARHGGGAADVDVAFGKDALEVTVTNPRRAGTPARNSGGHGLVGMQERALLLGGTVDAGASNGVFRVYARLPYEEQPA